MADLSYEVYQFKNTQPLVSRLFQVNSAARNVSFFVSETWLSVWLSELSKCGVKESEWPVLSAVLCGSKSVMSALVSRRVDRSGILPLNVGYVNETGLMKYDDIVIERNGFLFDSNLEAGAVSATELLGSLNVNLLKINNISDSQLSLFSSCVRTDGCILISRSKPSYFIDLNKVREGDGYLSLLSANKRRQIKRSMSLYTEQGELRVEQASTIEQAGQFFDELVLLHQKEWLARGNSGAFSNPFILDMQRSLIYEGVDSGLVRIFRVSLKNNGCDKHHEMNKPVGVIYGFMSEGDFLYYQSGFEYSSDNRLKPGLTCHALLVGHLAKENVQKYDFLAGRSPYKKSLSTDFYLMHDVGLYDNRFKSKVNINSKKLKSYLKGVWVRFRGSRKN